MFYNTVVRNEQSNDFPLEIDMMCSFHTQTGVTIVTGHVL